MNNNQKKILPVAVQTGNNSTGWIGDMPGSEEHFIKGQTFKPDKDGALCYIDVFPNIIPRKAKVMMTIYDFDSDKDHWGNSMGATTMQMNSIDSGKWVSFEFAGLTLEKGKTYGFKLDVEDAYIGMGEACGSYKQPVLQTGKEWQFTRKNPDGNAFTYFSLAFRVEVAA